jgi:hypothetical protein
MRKMKIKRHHFIFWIFLVPIIVFSITNIAFAASTSTLLRQIGSGAQTASGDYIGSNQGAGLDTYYRYFIEVPPGTARLTVDIYDADIGAVTNYTDWQIGGGYNTSCNYYLNNPAGGNVANVTYNNTQAAADSAWTQIYTVAAPAAGHWELRVRMNSAVTAGDDVNGYGIRAHDGTAGAGGTELNVYADSFIPLGVIGLNPTTITSTFYPYVTSGCTADWNDFDGDDDGVGTYIQLSYASRTGAVTGSYAGAGNDVWLNRPISNFETDLANINTGLWTATGRYTTLSGSTANFGVFYAGNYNAANPPPTAQPQANSFRVYLPTDGGGKPAKPFLMQKVSFVSGPNPPANGSTTRARIEVIFSNPTAHPVRINATSRRVIANVPGSGVVYAGNATVSQGSIASQPAVGGTGDVIWNPGIVAANTNITLRYEVNVTPGSAGQRLLLTGTGANGTRTTYRDETNVTAARAQYLYGPLCGLAVTEDGDPIPTWVAVTCFDACAEESQPTVEWHTAGEAGAVGFNLWRQDRETKEYVLVNPSLLPALPASPQGGVYRFADGGAFSGEPVVYRLEEIDTQGRSMTYGPFTVTFGGAAQAEPDDPGARLGREEESDIYGYRRYAHERSMYEQEHLNARRQEQRLGALLAASPGKERVRVTVKGRGLFYVSSAQIANSLGLARTEVSALISGYRISLSSLGKEIAWLADANGNGLFFYNEGQETVYSDKNIYFLERGRGQAMETVGGGNAGPADGNQTFTETLHFEDNRFPLLISSMDPLGDIWFWDYVVAGSSPKLFPVEMHGVGGSGRATLKVTLQGATNTAAKKDHHAIVMLNGRQVGEATWDGTGAHAFESAFDPSLLQEGANTISVSGALDMGAPYSIFYVESFDLNYQRRYQAVGDNLICRGAGNPVVTIGGFTELRVVGLDVSTPRKPQQLTGIAPDVSGRVTFVPRSVNCTYLLSGLNAALRPLSVVGDRPAQLKGASHSAEYIVIAPEEFAKTAQELADYRQGKGLKSLVVTLEDIYDAFNFGVPNPYAVRDFLAYASAGSGTGKVKFAVLAGKGTYDYNDYTGHGDNLVPVILAKTPDGLCAADKIFGDVTGRNGLPEIAVGRLPAVTNAELRTMIDKIKAYESGQGAWTEKAIFIADNADDGGDFTGGSNELAGLATGFQVEKINLAGSTQETRAKINASWNAGVGLVNYCGHAGLNQLATENIFNVSNAGALQNGGMLPLVMMFTCVAGRFENPAVLSLGEALLLNRNGGMAGGLFPSGAALHADSMRLAAEFYKAVFRGQEQSAGAALVAAMQRYLQTGGKASFLNVYNWLGDPALAIK